MDSLLLALAALIFLALALHPFVTYPLSLMALRGWRRRGPPPPLPTAAPDASLSLCVCAYNEEAVIRQKAVNLVALKRATPGLEILVYVDAATDRTAEILQEFADEITVVVASRRQGKTFGMERLIARARGEILVFSDANVMFAPDAVQELVRPFVDPSVGCVCGSLTYSNPDSSPTASVGSAFWRLEEWIKQLESDTGSVLCADGSIFAVRRSLYPEVPPDIIDDFYVSLSVLCEGQRIVRAGTARAWEQSTTSSTDEFRRKVRIACQAFNVHRLLWPRLARTDLLTRYKYVSHKLLRWVVAFNLGAAGVLGTAAATVAFGWEPTAIALLTGAVLMSVGLLLRVGPVRRLVEVLSAFVATALGLIRSIRGDRFQTWTPAASVREPFGGAPQPAGGAPWVPAPTAAYLEAPALRPIHASRAKRLLDVAGAAGLLVLFLPVMLTVTVVLRWHGGPALFRHRRVGAGGRDFPCLKFRTMHVDAERMLRELLERDPAAREEWERTFKLRDDPRVTRVGRFLRRTSLDELPQLFNVLRGEMSLVGPRPIVEKEVVFYDKYYRYYQQCRPGITGLWQVSGRSDVDYERRVELDCAYVTSWSVLRDVVILLRTPARVLRRDGAY